jgi:hypothetical protein
MLPSAARRSLRRMMMIKIITIKRREESERLLSGENMSY